MEKVIAHIEMDSEGTFSIYTEHKFPGFGVLGYGNTVDEAIEDFNEAFAELKADSEAKGNIVGEVEFEFKYDTASMLNYLDGFLTKAAIARLTGLNRTQLSHYASGLKKPRPETIAKIQDGLNHFVDTIKQVHLI